MAIPERIRNPSLNDYLEVMTKAVFQAGLRWALLDSKWPNFRRVFYDFDVHRVAAFKDKDIDSAASDEGIIRSLKKVQGTVKNARILLELEQQHGSIHNYFKSFDTYDALANDIRKRFAFMGEMSVYYFLFRVGEQALLPPFDSWITTIPGQHPRMREMVEHAAAQDAAL
jgi:3-methyladenine DNA glycosylase Tag